MKILGPSHHQSFLALANTPKVVLHPPFHPLHNLTPLLLPFLPPHLLASGTFLRSSLAAPSGLYRHLILPSVLSMRLSTSFHPILVTTISRPFLLAATPSSIFPFTRTPAPKRASVFSRISIYSMPPTPPLGSGDSLNSLVTGTPFPQSPQLKPRLVHLLPPRPRNSVANRVLHSIESFLLSFSFPPALEITT